MIEIKYYGLKIGQLHLSIKQRMSEIRKKLKHEAFSKSFKIVFSITV